jgi:hypothetical protein
VREVSKSCNGTGRKGAIVGLRLAEWGGPASISSLPCHCRWQCQSTLVPDLKTLETVQRRGSGRQGHGLAGKKSHLVAVPEAFLILCTDRKTKDPTSVSGSL